MITNISQAISLLQNYLDLHFGNHFNTLLLYADKFKKHESRNETGKRNYQLGQFRNLLASDFHVTQNEIDELTVALKIGIEDFHNNLIKVLLENYENPSLFKKIEEEISEISKDLQKAPYNYHSADLVNVLRAGIMFLLHKELDEKSVSNDWAGLSNQFDPIYIKDAPSSIHDQYLEDILVMREYLYEKYKDEPGFPIFVLNLIYTFPFKSLSK